MRFVEMRFVEMRFVEMRFVEMRFVEMIVTGGKNSGVALMRSARYCGRRRNYPTGASHGTF
jgi:hypothetical protein